MGKDKGHRPLNEMRRGVTCVAALAQRFHEGNETALDQLFRDIVPELCSLLARRHKHRLSRDEVEQIVIVAVAHAWRKRAKFDYRKGDLQAWLYRIVRRASVTFLRSPLGRSRRFQEVRDPDRFSELPFNLAASENLGGEMAGDSDEFLSNRERLIELVDEAPLKLPAKQREVLLADAASPSGAGDTNELAASLGATPSTVRQWRCRAKKRLKEILEGLGVESLLHCHTRSVVPCRESNEQRTTNNEHRTTNNEQRTTNNEQRTTNNEQRTKENIVILLMSRSAVDGGA